MYVFIDDSGDAGFKLAQGSSQMLVIACCIFTTAEDAEHVAGTMRDFRRSLGWNPLQEFKFSKMSDEIRLSFLSRLSHAPFVVRALVIDKTSFSLESRGVHSSASFYSFAIQEALSHASSLLVDAKVVIDGKSSKSHSKSIGVQLRSYLNRESQTVAKISFVDSEGNQLIQLADIMAGTIRKAFDVHSKGRETYLLALSPYLKGPSSEIREHGIP